MSDTPSHSQHTHQNESAQTAANENGEFAPETVSFDGGLQLLRHRGAGSIDRKAQAAQKLSGLIGNRALQRIVAPPQANPLDASTAAPSVTTGANPVLAPASPGIANGLPANTNADGSPSREIPTPPEMQAFLDRGVMPNAQGQDVVGAGMGGFNAKFDPVARQLVVTLNVGFTLLNGLTVTPTGQVSASVGGLNASNPDEQGTIAQLTAAATNLNQQRTSGALTAAQVVTIVNTQWQWAAGESTGWLNQYRADVQNAWSARHYFTSQDWPQLSSNVRMIANTHLAAQATDHTAAKIVKTPPGGVGAYVAPGQANNAHDQQLMMSSSGLSTTNNAQLLRWNLNFPNDSSTVATASLGSNSGDVFLNKFIQTYAGASPTGGAPIQVIGFAGTGDDPAQADATSLARANAVRDYLVAQGLTNAANRVTVTSRGLGGQTNRKVEIVVGSGEVQATSAHEFGHMIGLGDEYVTGANSLITGTGNAVGSNVAHTDVNSNSLGDRQIDGAVAENNDNIMSLGNAVRPQHYSTFHNALQIVTGRQWRYGGEGDAPQGTPMMPGTPMPGGGVLA